MSTTAAIGGRPDPATWQAIARRRAEAPDELERRDLGGLARWLAEGLAGGSDPADFVRSGGDLDADAA